MGNTIKIIRGNSLRLKTIVYGDSTLQAKQPLGEAVAVDFVARRGSATGPLEFVKTLSSGVTVSNASAGEITITINPADTIKLPRQDCVLAYSITITWPGNQVVTTEEGKILVDLPA
jgi:hypothetical protein